jgi:hypothetical protein
MVRIIFVLLILFGNYFQPETSEKFLCTLTSDKQIYSLGEIPKFSISIKNNTADSVMFVKTLDGSAEKIRYPYCYFTITMPDDTAYKIRKLNFCHNSDPIRKEDFVKVAPGNYFDPYKDQFVAYYDNKITDAKNFAVKGKYTITFYYSTSESNFNNWLGFWNKEWFDGNGNIAERNKPQYDEMKILFAEVPQVDLVSNSVTIEIK